MKDDKFLQYCINCTYCNRIWFKQKKIMRCMKNIVEDVDISKEDSPKACGFFEFYRGRIEDGEI